jgi:hypothetical protein
MALVGLAALASVAAPLLTYSLTLAVFGLPHVIQEMRYLRRRFDQALGAVFWAVIALLALVAISRFAAFMDVLSYSSMRGIELATGTGLVLLVAPRWWARGGVARWTGLAVTVGLVAGLLLAPIPTMLVVAVGHNWTPVPLLMDTRPSRLWVGLAALAFVVVPVLIATGLPWQLLTTIGLTYPELDVVTGGTLFQQFSAYLPRSWHLTSWAQHAFSAIVFAQCAHYIAVLGVMPAVHDKGERVVPKRWLVAVCIAVLSVALMGLYTLDFRASREFYGVFSSMHAWVEIPIILLLLRRL